MRPDFIAAQLSAVTCRLCSAPRLSVHGLAATFCFECGERLNSVVNLAYQGGGSRPFANHTQVPKTVQPLQAFTLPCFIAGELGRI